MRLRMEDRATLSVLVALDMQMTTITKLEFSRLPQQRLIEWEEHSVPAGRQRMEARQPRRHRASGNLANF